MTLQEAIKLLTQLSEPPEIIFHADDIKAVKLGIEALKYVYSQYDPDHQMMRRPLPGETLE